MKKSFFFDNKIIILMTGIGILGLSLLIRKIEEYHNRNVVKIGYVLIFLAIAVGAGCFVFFSWINRSVSLGNLEKYLRFSRSWGTERGYVWTWLWNIFCDAEWKRKIFGYGQGSVVIVLLEKYSKEMFQGLGYGFDNAHNVYLHELISTGIFGVVSYVALLLNAIIQGLKKEKMQGVVVALIAVSIMDVVSIKEPITFIYVWFYFGLCLESGERHR